MRKPPPAIEWHIVENEADWARLHGEQVDHKLSPPASYQPFYQRSFEILILTLALGLTTSGWWWLTQAASQPDTPTVGHEQPPLHHPFVTSDYDRLVTQVRSALRREAVPKDSSLLTGIPSNDPERYLEPAFVIINLQNDWAVACMIAPVKDGWLGLQDQRFFHRTASGWQQAVLDEKVLTALRQQQTTPIPLGAVCN